MVSWRHIINFGDKESNIFRLGLLKRRQMSNVELYQPSTVEAFYGISRSLKKLAQEEAIFIMSFRIEGFVMLFSQTVTRNVSMVRLSELS